MILAPVIVQILDGLPDDRSFESDINEPLIPQYSSFCQLSLRMPRLRVNPEARSLYVVLRQYRRSPDPLRTVFVRTDSQVGRNGLPIRGTTSGPARRPLFWVAFDHLLRQWGTPELTERAAQDLYFNVRSLAPSLSRLRLFEAFSGCLAREGSGPSFEDDVELQDEEAVAFYLRAVVTFHRVRDQTATGAEASANGVLVDPGGRKCVGASGDDDELKK